MLYIKVDGNYEIGIGHVMRCLSIAQAYRNLGGDCAFIAADRETESLIRQKGFAFYCLDSQWNHLDTETEQLERFIKTKEVKKLLVDSYFVTETYLNRLKRLTSISYLDDLYRFVYPCHLLINYNCYADTSLYSDYPPDTQFLLGSQYAPLRTEFQNLPVRTAIPKVNHLLILTGGADPYNMGSRLCRHIFAEPALRGITCHVAAGRFHQYLNELRELAARGERVRIYEQSSQMANLMRSCDIAVSAAGSTLYELCACGTPTVCFAMADNQLDGVKGFSSQGLMDYAGDVRDDLDGCLQHIVDRIVTLRQDITARQERSKKMQRIVDGFGAFRIAKYLRAL